MSKQKLHVPAGKLFCLSSGEYSDYRVNAYLLALVEITPEMFREVESECKGAQKIENEKEEFQYDGFYGADEKFLPALIKRGWIMDIDCVEIHTGSYGELDLA